MHHPSNLALSFLILWTRGLTLGEVQDVPPRVIGLEIRQDSIVNPHTRDQQRRGRRAVQVALDNLVMLYSVEISVGTPPQQITVHLDTGSSDLWVNSPRSKLCQGPNSPCAETYTANASSTYGYVGSHFDISYVDGTAAAGDYVIDQIILGNATLRGCQFGVGYNSTSASSVLGIGYRSNEVQVTRAGLAPYDNLPAKMVSQGLIQSNAYSLYLGNIQASKGSILFGGVNADHFTGNLQTLPVQTGPSGVHNRFLITLTDVSFGSVIVANNLSLAVLLDSGTTLTYLPDHIATEIFLLVGAAFEEREFIAYVSCDLAAELQSNVIFAFSDARIVVPLSELVLDVLRTDGLRPALSNGKDACLFGIAPAGNGSNTLGATFMRSAYFVFDMDNNEISLAQTNLNAATSNIIEIGQGKDAVPSAIRVANPAVATQGMDAKGNSGRVLMFSTLVASSSMAFSILAGSGLFIW